MDLRWVVAILNTFIYNPSYVNLPKKWGAQEYPAVKHSHFVSSTDTVKHANNMIKQYWTH